MKLITLFENIKYKRQLIFLLIVFHKLLLDILYINFLAKSYAFYTFLSDYSISWYITSWIVLSTFSIWLIFITKNKEKNFSSLVIFILFSILFVPFTSMMYGGYDSEYLIANITLWFFLLIFLGVFLQLQRKKVFIKILNKSVEIKKYIISKDPTYIVILGVTSILTVIYLSAIYSGFRLSFDLDSAYVFRVEAQILETPVLLNYLFSWSRIIIPTLITLSIIRKKYVLLVILFGIQLLSFGYDGIRLSVIITFASLIVPFIFRKITSGTITYIYILIGFILLSIASIFEHIVFKSSEIDRIFTFRVFFLPNVISSWFYDFFSNNTPDYFRSSFLRYFGFISPYNEYGVDYLISGLYLNDFVGRANNGLLGDAMTNMGLIGLAVLPLLINIWLHFIDRVSKHVDSVIIILVAIYFAYALTNNFFTIILFTNGGVIIILLLHLLNVKFIYSFKTNN
jgi:oligosaccharide repeat unit polymerase